MGLAGKAADWPRGRLAAGWRRGAAGVLISPISAGVRGARGLVGIVAGREPAGPRGRGDAEVIHCLPSTTCMYAPRRMADRSRQHCGVFVRFSNALKQLLKKLDGCRSKAQQRSAPCSTDS